MGVMRTPILEGATMEYLKSFLSLSFNQNPQIRPKTIKMQVYYKKKEEQNQAKYK
jgi:hypothetical protein